MENSSAKFWIGLGIGSIAGAMAYRFSRTSKAKRLKRKMCHAWHEVNNELAGKADEVKEKVQSYANKAKE